MASLSYPSLRATVLCLLLLLPFQALAYVRFYPQPVGTQYLYVFQLFGKFVASGFADPIAGGNMTMSLNVTKYNPQDSMYAQSYSMKLNGTIVGFAGNLTTLSLSRGSQHSVGSDLYLWNLTTKWKYSMNKLNASVASFSISVANTSTLESTGFPGYILSYTLQYLTIYSGHNYIQIASTKFPYGAVRGQLVNVKGYPIVPS